MPSIAFLFLALGMGAHLELEGVVEQYVHHSQDSLGATQEAVRLLSVEETELLRMSLTKCVDPECSPSLRPPLTLSLCFRFYSPESL